MRDKNEDIHLFILDEDRKKSRNCALREKVVREWLREPTEQLVTPPQNSFAIQEEFCKEETMSVSERNQAAIEKQECGLRGIEHEFLKAGSFGLERKDQNLKIELVMPTAIVASSLISIIALLRLDAVVHQDLYSYGLQFSLEWATPYWVAIRTALGLLWLMIITAVLFQIRVLSNKSRGKGTDEQWKTYKLADGSTIRVKSVLKGVKRLKEYGHDGKLVYLIEAENVVEVIAPL